jgi:hypothetical protein
VVEDHLWIEFDADVHAVRLIERSPDYQHVPENADRVFGDACCSKKKGAADFAEALRARGVLGGLLEDDGPVLTRPSAPC